jgi:hypothetical protein
MNRTQDKKKAYLEEVFYGCYDIVATPLRKPMPLFSASLRWRVFSLDRLKLDIGRRLFGVLIAFPGISLLAFENIVLIT